MELRWTTTLDPAISPELRAIVTAVTAAAPTSDEPTA
jgi:hypothetical protein